MTTLRNNTHVEVGAARFFNQNLGVHAAAGAEVIDVFDAVVVVAPGHCELIGVNRG